MPIFCAPVAAFELTATVTVAEWPVRREAGLMLTVTPAGALAVRPRALVPDPLETAETWKGVVLPCRPVPDAGDSFSVKSVVPLLLFVPDPHSLTSSAPFTEPRPV